MRSFAAHRKPGWNLLQRRAAAEETFHGAAFPAPLFSSEDERPRLQGKEHRSPVPLHALRRCLAACRSAEPAHQKPVHHRALGSRPQRRFRRNNGVRPALRSMPDSCPHDSAADLCRIRSHPRTKIRIARRSVNAGDARRPFPAICRSGEEPARHRPTQHKASTTHADTRRARLRAK